MSQTPHDNPNECAFIRVKLVTLPIIVRYLQSIGAGEEAKQIEDFAACYARPEADAERKEWIERGRKQLAKRHLAADVQIDDDAALSGSDAAGDYVMAWVWVDGPEDQDDDEEDE